MSNVYDLFPHNPQPSAPNTAVALSDGSEKSNGIGLSDESSVNAQAQAPDQTIILVSDDDGRRLDMAAILKRQSSHSIFVQTLGSLLFDLEFKMPDEVIESDDIPAARGFQLTSHFYQQIAEFSERHKTTPGIVSHLAITNYLPATIPQSPNNPYRPKRHLRSV